MQDHSQEFEESQRAAFVLRDNSVSYSFIASYHDGSDLTEDSIISINEIGLELGVEYEIFIPLDRNSPNSFLRKLAVKLENVKLMKFGHGIAGTQKRMIQSVSSGSYVVLFDPSRKYGIEFADLLHSFSARRDEVVLFSDLLVIPSVIFRRVGTWKGLRSAEDLEMLSRISGITGLVAYNPPGIDLNISSNEPLLLKSGKTGFRIRRLYDLVLKQRDQIRGSSYSVADIMKYYRMNGNRKPGRLFLIFYSFFISGIWFRKSGRPAENNYTVVLDRLLESLILADFRRYPDFLSAPRLLIQANDVDFLKETGKVWGRIVEDLSKYVVLPGRK